MIRFIILIILAIGLACTAPDDDNTPLVDLTGVWYGTMSGLPTAGEFTLELTQNEATVAGTYINDLGQYCSVSGTVSGYDVSMTLNGITIPGYRASVRGTATEHNAYGGYSDNEGNSGTWSASR